MTTATTTATTTTTPTIYTTKSYHLLSLQFHSSLYLRSLLTVLTGYLNGITLGVDLQLESY